MLQLLFLGLGWQICSFDTFSAGLFYGKIFRRVGKAPMTTDRRYFDVFNFSSQNSPLHSSAGWGWILGWLAVCYLKQGQVSNVLKTWARKWWCRAGDGTWFFLLRGERRRRRRRVNPLKSLFCQLALSRRAFPVKPIDGWELSFCWLEEMLFCFVHGEKDDLLFWIELTFDSIWNYKLNMESNCLTGCLEEKSGQDLKQWIDLKFLELSNWDGMTW